MGNKILPMETLVKKLGVQFRPSLDPASGCKYTYVRGF